MSGQASTTQMLITLAIGLLLGVIIGALVARNRSAARMGALQAELDGNRAVANERLERLNSDSQGLHSVQTLVGPVTTSLNELNQRIGVAERDRLRTEATLTEQLRTMTLASESLRSQTGQLAHALSRSEFRGRWGEMQLRRVVEAAGLLRGVDFIEQATTPFADSSLIPDVVVTMSDNRKIVIDAKVALDALLDPAVETAPAEQARKHAAAVSTHIDQLSGKEYWKQFEQAPEFVVMFLPAESLLGTALQVDPGLLERAFSRNVVLATPATLLALLRTVAMGWRNYDLAENATAILSIGRDLHGRLQVMSNHLTKVGSSLDGAVSSYNKLVGSYEGRVLVAARKMAEMGVTHDDLASVSTIERTSRTVAGVAVAAVDDD